MHDPFPTPPPTAKERARRIKLGYVHGTSRLDRLKRGLGLGALAITLTWMGCSLVGLQSREIYSRGPLANVHAMWDHQCDACHAGFQPVRDGTIATLLGTSSQQTDHLCQSCHQGPAHNPHQLANSVASCGTCHRDHRGRDASLVRIDDAQCTSCHADLERHVQPGTELHFAAHITSFAGDDSHPQFSAVQATDPGRLKFTHAQHLLPGMPRVPGQPGWFRLDQLAPSDRDTYRLAGQSDDALVQLDCNSCHLLDPTANASNADGRHLSGDYFLTVRYEQHCQACHPLSIDSPQTPAADQVAQGQPALPPPPREAPHGLQPTDLRQWLTTAWLNQWIQTEGELLAQPLSPSRHPAQRLATAVESIQGALDRDVDQSLSLLLQHAKACGKCHYFERDGVPLASLLPGDVSHELAQLRIVPPAIPQVWFAHARFDHLSHRAITCRDCHAQAYPDASESIRWNGASESKQVLLPGIETCRQCHAPADSSWNTTSGGAGFDCTECHRYHHGDDPRHGPGSRQRDAAVERGIHELLLGTPPQPSAPQVLP